VSIVNDESLHINRSEDYKDSKAEKNTRGVIKAAVEREISKDTVVICDSLNYIKGYRYELFCSARAVGTPSCVVWLDIEKEQALERNSNNPDTKSKWQTQLITELMMRFEPPNSTRRWEKPTFVVHDERDTPFQEILDCVTAKYTSQINMATQHQKISDTNYLHNLDKITQDVIKAILQRQEEISVGDLLVTNLTQRPLRLTRKLTMSELRRLRQSYVTFAKSMAGTKSSFGEQSADEIAAGFMEYINTQIAAT